MNFHEALLASWIKYCASDFWVRGSIPAFDLRGKSHRDGISKNSKLKNIHVYSANSNEKKKMRIRNYQ